MIRLKFKFDDQFLIETFKRYRRQHAVRNTWLILKVLCIVIFLILSIVSVFHNDYKLIIFFAAIIILMLYGHKIDYLVLKYRCRKSPYINEQVEITISDEDYRVLSDKFETKSLWSVFTKAVVFSDGFLLMQGPGLFNWLPVKNITQGSAQELNQLIKNNIKEYKVIEQINTADRQATPASR
jgi:uncharacterized protein YhhL (DUF1145 family)